MADGKKVVGNLRGPAPWVTPQPWVAGTKYGSKAPAAAVIQPDGVYVCTKDHIAGATFDPSNWVQILKAAVSVPGDPGAPGAPGATGAQVFSGSGAPSADVIANARAGVDSYLDLVSGDTYAFT